MVVFGSSFAIQSKDIGNEDLFLFARAKLAKTEMVRDQNRTIKLEGLLAEFGERDQKAIDELKEKIEVEERLEAEVVEMKKQ